MKTVKTTLAAMMLLFCSIVANAQPMSYYAMRDNARFLTDRMAYTLGITSGLILDDLYRINYDYICGVNDYLDEVALGYRYDDYMAVMYERDRALRILLGTDIWARLVTYDYFYRPIVFINKSWRFGIYAHDPRHNYFYCAAPRHFQNYRGGHFFTGMHPANRPPHGMKPNDRRPGFHLENKKTPNNTKPDRNNRGTKGNPHTDNMRPQSGNQTRPGNNNMKTTEKNNGRSSGNNRSSSRSGFVNVSNSRTSSAKAHEAVNASRNESGSRSGRR